LAHHRNCYLSPAEAETQRISGDLFKISQPDTNVDPSLACLPGMGFSSRKVSWIKATQLGFSKFLGYEGWHILASYQKVLVDLRTKKCSTLLGELA
jgi:N6-adenosine-specific RNA methylase IME4